MAFEYAVVKHEINAVVAVIKRNTTLPGFEAKTFSCFQQKILQVVDDGLFEIGFRKFGLFFQAKELQDVGASDKICRVESAPAAVFVEHILLMLAQTGAFEKQTVHGTA